MNQPEKKPEPSRTIMAFLKRVFQRILATKRVYLISMWILLATIALIFFLTGSGGVLPAIYIAL